MLKPPKVIWAMSACIASISMGCSDSGESKVVPRKELVALISSIPSSQRSVIWVDDATGVTYLPLVGVDDERVAEIRAAGDSLNLKIVRGDLSILQLEQAQSILSEKLAGMSLGIGLSTDKGQAYIFVKVSSELESAVRQRISMLAPEDLGGVDPQVIRLELGVVGRNE